MQKIIDGWKGLRLLMSLNFDRLMVVIVLGAALILATWVAYPEPTHWPAF